MVATHTHVSWPQLSVMAGLVPAIHPQADEPEVGVRTRQTQNRGRMAATRAAMTDSRAPTP
jgi:hypothetical protein